MVKLRYIFFVILYIYVASAYSQTRYVNRLKNATAELHNNYWGAVVRSDACIKRDKKLEIYRTVLKTYKKRNYPVLEQARKKVKIYFRADKYPKVGVRLDRELRKYSRQMIQLNARFVPNFERKGKNLADEFCNQWLEALKQGKLDLNKRDPAEYRFVYSKRTR